MAFRLLIVDDDPVTLLALREALQLRFSEAIIGTAGSAEDALTQMNTSPDFDIVLTDFRMPGMGGMDLLREIKARYPGCAVFLMTAHGPDVRVEALRLGASAFLDKPLDMQRLGTLLARTLEQARLLNAVHERPRDQLGPNPS